MVDGDDVGMMKMEGRITGGGLIQAQSRYRSGGGGDGGSGGRDRVWIRYPGSSLVALFLCLSPVGMMMEEVAGINTHLTSSYPKSRHPTTYLRCIRRGEHGSRTTGSTAASRPNYRRVVVVVVLLLFRGFTSHSPPWQNKQTHLLRTSTY